MSLMSRPEIEAVNFSSGRSPRTARNNDRKSVDQTAWYKQSESSGPSLVAVAEAGQHEASLWFSLSGGPGSLEFSEEDNTDSHAVIDMAVSSDKIETDAASAAEPVVIQIGSTAEVKSSVDWPLIAACFVEFLASLVFFLCGQSVQAHFVAAVQHSANSIAVSCGWALAYTLALCIAQGLSHGHVSPAITLSLAVSGRFWWRRSPGWVAAQVGGALVAGGIVYNAFYRHLGSLSATADPFIAPPASAALTLLFAFIGSANLAIGWNLHNKLSRIAVIRYMSPLLLGLVYLGLVYSVGEQAGSTLNPAADIASALIVWATHSTADSHSSLAGYNSNLALSIIGTLVGAVIGQLLFDFVCAVLDSLLTPRPAAPDSRVMSPEMSRAEFAALHRVISIGQPVVPTSELDDSTLTFPREAPTPVGPKLETVVVVGK